MADIEALKKTVDAFGALKAKQGALKEKEEEYKEILISSGETEIDGYKYRATVASFIKTSVPVDVYRAFVVKQLGEKGAAKWFLKNSKETDTTVVKVVALKK